MYCEGCRHYLKVEFGGVDTADYEDCLIAVPIHNGPTSCTQRDDGHEISVGSGPPTPERVQEIVERYGEGAKRYGYGSTHEHSDLCAKIEI